MKQVALFAIILTITHFRQPSNHYLNKDADKQQTLEITTSVQYAAVSQQGALDIG